MFHLLLAVIGAVVLLEIIVLFCATDLLIWLRQHRLVPKDAQQYFIRGLSQQQYKKLDGASIPFGTTAIDPDEGALFDRAHLKTVLKVLDAEVIAATSLHGKQICELVVHFRPADHQDSAVRIGGKLPLMHRLVLKRLVREIIGSQVKRDIFVHLRAGVVNPPKDEQFHVVIGGAPKASHQVRLNRICGLVSSNISGFAYTGVGHMLVDESTKTVLGEIVGECLYLYMDVAPNTKHAPNFALLTRMLQLAAEELGSDSFMEDISAYLASEGIGGKSTHPVIIEPSFEGRLGNIVKSVVEAAVAPSVNREIIIAHAGGRPIAPLEDGSFGVFLYSAPQGRPCLPPLLNLWGISGLSSSPRFAPSPKGLLLNDDGGNVAGELHANALYIHSDILNTGTAPELAVLTRILVRAVKAMPLLDNPAGIERAGVNALEKACLKMVLQTPAATLTSDELRSSRRSYHEVMQRLADSERNLLSMWKQTEGQFGVEFDALSNIEKVVSVEVRGNAITLHTSTIYCVNPDTHVRHHIGAFEIQLHLDTGDVRWLNQTQKILGHHAPHIGPSGSACLGNMASVFHTMILAGQIPSAAEAAIAFVESVNVRDSWGKHIVAWPKA